ncbi:hypothetical protein J6590_004840 [Homalodisca vitripennis]|nr:hypothetical protein J6590_004840 [Homalodisca vitripennis]
MDYQDPLLIFELQTESKISTFILIEKKKQVLVFEYFVLISPFLTLLKIFVLGKVLLAKLRLLYHFAQALVHDSCSSETIGLLAFVNNSGLCNTSLAFFTNPGTKCGCKDCISHFLQLS